jgi:hypothetical protein
MSIDIETDRPESVVDDHEADILVSAPNEFPLLVILVLFALMMAVAAQVMRAQAMQM